MKVDLKSVLWRTRGRGWDYAFVLRPLHPIIEGWYDFHVDVFAGITPALTPVNRGGILVTDDKEVPFIATAFQDAEAKDVAGRPVAHYLVCFLPHRERLVPRVRSDWGAEVVRYFGNAWSQTFFGPGDLDKLLSDARTDLREIDLVGGTEVPVSFALRIGEKKKPAITSDRRSSKIALLVLATITLVLLLGLLSR